MTDRQAKAVAMAALGEMYEWIPLKDYRGPLWVAHRGRTTYTFVGNMPATELRCNMAVWLAKLGHYLSFKTRKVGVWSRAYGFITRMKRNVADGAIPFYKAIWLSKL